MGSKHRKGKARRHAGPAPATNSPSAPSDSTHTEEPKTLSLNPAPELNAAVSADDSAPEQELPLPVPEDVITPEAAPCESPREEAKSTVEGLAVRLLAANLSPITAIGALRGRSVVAADVRTLIESLRADIELSEAEESALAAFSKTGSAEIDVDALFDLAGAATFHVEMLEFQIRQALMERASTKTRAKMDVQRAVGKLLLHLPTDIQDVSSKDFEVILEEKLGCTAGSHLLSRIVFARITAQPPCPRLPKLLRCSKATFLARFEAFILDKPLSMDSVEGQLRHLLSKHVDLRATFEALDADRSGAISLDEFVSFLEREARMAHPRDVIGAFIQRFDTDGDGTLSYDEFIQFVSPRQFGIQVLTPFGMFYHASDRREPMGEVVAKIKTRMFWMQHNDLFSMSTNPLIKPPFKLKVTDQFVLTHHYGALRLEYKDSDPIAKVLTNGEMVVLVLVSETSVQSDNQQLPPFEYRLRPKIKRTIPPLMSWSLADSTSAAKPEPTDSTAKSAEIPRRKSTVRRPTITCTMKAQREHDDDQIAVAATRASSSTRPSSRPKFASNRGGSVRKGVVASAMASQSEPVSDPEASVVDMTTREEQPAASTQEEPVNTWRDYASADVPLSLEESADYEHFDMDSDAFGSVMVEDESMPPCLAGATVDCDEEPPPPYDDG